MSVGATHTDYVKKGIEDYYFRLRHYVQFSIVELPDAKGGKSMSREQQKELEGKGFLSKIGSGDMLVLLDERGREFTSKEFAGYLEKLMASGRKRVVFLIGGPYGFSPAVYQRADAKISLSKMTFNHEMVRLFFIEQIYRGMTILRGEPYHHD